MGICGKKFSPFGYVDCKIVAFEVRRNDLFWDLVQKGLKALNSFEKIFAQCIVFF